MDLEIRDAVLQENCSFIKKWLSKNDVNLTDEEGSSLLHFSSSQNKEKVVKLLLSKGASVKIQDKKGWTPLHCAAYDKHLNICKALLKSNADPTIQNNSQTNAVFYIVRCKEDPELIVKVLEQCFRRGATPNERNSHSETLLMVTCLQGIPSTVEYLIQCGADINAQSKRKETALFYAVRARNIETLNILLQNHINVLLPANGNVTAIDEAKATQWEEGHAILNQYIVDNAPMMDIAVESIPPRFPKFHQGVIFQSPNTILAYGGAITAVQYSNQLYSFDLNDRSWVTLQTYEDNSGSSSFRGPISPRNSLYSLTPSGGSSTNVNNNSNNNNPNVVSPRSNPPTHRHSLRLSGGHRESVSPRNSGVANKPPQMSGHSIVAHNNLIYIFGGRNSFQTFSDVFSYNIDTSSWTNQVNMKFAQPLCYHSSILFNDKVITFGGSSSKGAFPLHNNLIIHNLTTVNTHTILPDNSPCPRMQHSCDLIAHNMYIFGGTTLENVLNDLYVLDCLSLTWSKPVVKGRMPTPRFGHSSCIYQKKLYIYGGINDKGFLLSDFYEFNPQTSEWIEINLPIQSQRSGHSLITNDKDLYIVGGSATTNNLLKINIKLLASRPSTNTFTPEKKKLEDSQLPLGSLRSKISNYEASTLRKHKDDGNNLSSKEIIHGTIRKSVATRPQKKKKSSESISLLKNRIEILDNYNQHLTENVYSLISGLEKEITKNDPFDKNNITSVLSIISSLKDAIENEKPPVIWDGCDLMIKPLPKSASNSLTNGSSISNIDPERRKTISAPHSFPFPRHHYEILSIPPKRIPPVYQKSESDTPLEKEIRNRNLVLNEILTTETDYVRDLAVIIGLYLRPLQNEYAELIGIYEIKNLFKNVEQLWEVNNNLLATLLEEEKKPPRDQQIGKIFLDYSPQLANYNVYCANQVTTSELIEKLLKENSKFRDFVDQAASYEECNLQDIRSYLIKPFQRITRYTLLLKELAKNTPTDWEDLPFIENAKKEIDVVVKGANETKRVNDKMLKILELQNRLDRDANPMLSSLHKFEYMMDIPVKDINLKSHKGTKCLLYLFEEMVLVVQPKGQKFVRRYFFQTPSISLQSDFKPTSKVKFPIELQFKDERFVFDCLTPTYHTELLNSLTQLLKEFK